MYGENMSAQKQFILKPPAPKASSITHHLIVRKKVGPGERNETASFSIFEPGRSSQEICEMIRLAVMGK